MAAKLPTRVDLSAVGTTGLKRMGGIIREEYLRELRGPQGQSIYTEMSTQDAVLGGVLFAIEMLIRGMDWPVVPASQDPVDLENAEFVEGALRDMETPWKDLLSEILTFLVYGWCLLEVLWKLRQGEQDDPTRRSAFDDGLIGWRDWQIRSQDTLDRWEFDEEGNVTAMVQVAEPDFRPRVIPLDKCLLFRTTTRKGSPEGRSVLRTAYREWYLKRHIETMEAIGAERDLAGLPVMGVPAELLRPDASPEEKALAEQCMKIVTNVRNDEQGGILLPLEYDENGHPLYELRLLTAGGQRMFDTDKIITRKENRMAASLLADFILLGQQAVGSFALASEKTRLFSFAIAAWADVICSVVNRRAIPRLLRLNGKEWSAGPPTLQHGDIETVDPKALAEFIAAAASAGGPITPEMWAHVYRLVGLPVPEEGLA